LFFFVAYSLAALDSTSTDGTPNGRMDNVVSCSPLPQSESAVSVSEHQQSLTECVEVRSPGVVGEYGTNEMISSKVTHSQPRLQHQEATQNFKVSHLKTYDNILFGFCVLLIYILLIFFLNLHFMMYQAYEPDSGYGMSFITKVVDGEATQSMAYSSEVRSTFCFLVDMFRNCNFIWIVCLQTFQA